ncbi:MAG: hypothetical protein E7339_03810 [Clostridiales bacterium]|nr:hypothetical protein [Clostridiales bacterium]MBQ7407976.1 septum formation initiator family protein [Clostridia bacterium]
MTLEKLQRIAAAVTASAVLLLFILVGTLVYQMSIINGKRAKIEQLNAEIATLRQQNEEVQNDIDRWLNEWKIEERANELGYVYERDK